MDLLGIGKCINLVCSDVFALYAYSTQAWYIHQSSCTSDMNDYEINTSSNTDMVYTSQLASDAQEYEIEYTRIL